MLDDYVGVTIRKEILEKEGITISLELLKEIAAAAMGYYCRSRHKSCPEIRIEKRLPANLGIEEYDVKPVDDLRIKLSLEPDNYAPFNCWMEADRPDSKEWALMTALGGHLSAQFPGLTFSASSSYFYRADCAEDEKYTNLFRNGAPAGQLTRREWIAAYPAAD